MSVIKLYAYLIAYILFSIIDKRRKTRLSAKIMDFIKKYKWIFLFFMIGIIGFIMFTVNQNQGIETPGQDNFSSTPMTAEKTPDKLNSMPEKNPTDSTDCYIDVKGEVKQPGVYKAASNERVQDVIAQAGGFKSSADVNQINLAEKLHDEMVIYVPKKGEMAAAQPVHGASLSNAGSQNSQNNAGSSQSKVNINTATAEELQNIPGIGPSKAKAIVEYRTQNGPFKKEEDIKNVTGIGDKTYEKLADSITAK
jgi:competence protein ComEA